MSEGTEAVKVEPLSKDGIPLDKEGVSSPARIHIRSVKEGGKANPSRLQVIMNMQNHANEIACE